MRLPSGHSPSSWCSSRIVLAGIINRHIRCVQVESQYVRCRAPPVIGLCDSRGSSPSALSPSRPEYEWMPAIAPALGIPTRLVPTAPPPGPRRSRKKPPTRYPLPLHPLQPLLCSFRLAAPPLLTYPLRPRHALRAPFPRPLSWPMHRSFVAAPVGWNLLLPPPPRDPPPSDLQPQADEQETLQSIPESSLDPSPPTEMHSSRPSSKEGSL